MSDFLFTSESVSEGHPDKVADQISDAVLDAILAQDPRSRVAAETLVKDNLVVLAGEITTNARVNYDAVARQTIRRIGYTDPNIGFDVATEKYGDLIELGIIDPAKVVRVALQNVAFRLCAFEGGGGVRLRGQLSVPFQSGVSGRGLVGGDRPRGRGARGQALVEFALVLPDLSETSDIAKIAQVILDEVGRAARMDMRGRFRRISLREAVTSARVGVRQLDVGRSAVWAAARSERCPAQPRRSQSPARGHRFGAPRALDRA